jgi:hypothetical protein
MTNAHSQREQDRSQRRQLPTPNVGDNGLSLLDEHRVSDEPANVAHPHIRNIGKMRAQPWASFDLR